MAADTTLLASRAGGTTDLVESYWRSVTSSHCRRPRRLIWCNRLGQVTPERLTPW